MAGPDRPQAIAILESKNLKGTVFRRTKCA